MPGIHTLTVIAFLILYSEKMQEVNVRSRNSGLLMSKTGTRTSKCRCCRGSRSARVQMCKHLIFYHKHVVIRPWSAPRASVKFIKGMFSYGSLAFLGSGFCLTACGDEACGQSQTAAGSMWQPDRVFRPSAPAE